MLSLTFQMLKILHVEILFYEILQKFYIFSLIKKLLKISIIYELKYINFSIKFKIKSYLFLKTDKRIQLFLK